MTQTNISTHVGNFQNLKNWEIWGISQIPLNLEILQLLSGHEENILELEIHIFKPRKNNNILHIIDQRKVSVKGIAIFLH